MRKSEGDNRSLLNFFYGWQCPDHAGDCICRKSSLCMFVGYGMSKSKWDFPVEQ